MKNVLLNRRLHERLCSAATALLTLTLCLAGTAPSAFGQLGEPTHTVIAFHLDTSTGNITVGNTVYKGASPGLHLLALKRQPNTNHLDAPDVVEEGVFVDATSANSFLQDVLSKSSDALLIANGVGSYGVALGDIAQNLERFGGQVDLEVPPPAIPFIFVGNGGRNKGGAFQRGYSTRPVDGYLAQDSHGKYAFIQTDFVRYDIQLDGTIKIGSATYDVASSYKPGCGAGDAPNSFHLVVVDRESLQLQLINNTYCTAQSDVEIIRLVNDISAHLVGSNSNEGLLIFLASNGHPIPANWNFGTDGDARIYPLAQEIASFGGYWETMVYLTPNDAYSLVGAAPPPSYVARARSRARESSSVYPDHPSGELHGVLARGRSNWYSPIDADASAGKANLGLYDILATPANAFPNYTPDYTPAPNQPTFYEYISSQLCEGPCNLRDQYTNRNFNNFSNYHQTLETITVDPYDPNVPKRDCTNSANEKVPFCMERTQILNELNLMPNMRQFEDNVKTLWSEINADNTYGLIKTWQTVQATLPPPAQPTAPGLASPIVNLVLGLAGAAPTPLAPLFGLADTFFNFGMSLATDPQGNQTASLATPVASLATQAQDNFNQQLNAIATQFNMIYQDWAKFSALGAAVAHPPVGSPWYWDDGASTAMLPLVQPAMEQAMYQSLMSSVYAIGKYLPNDPGWSPSWGGTPLWAQPSAYYVYSPKGPIPPGNEQFVQPFHTQGLWYDGGFAYVPFTYPTDSTNNWINDQRTGTILADGSWLAISLQSSSIEAPSGHYDPPEDLLGKLFTPASASGLGVYRPAFFEGWPFPRVTCTPSGGHGSPGGCNWSAAAPPLEAFPEPVTKVSVAVAGVSRNGTRLDVQLTIHNSGTRDITSLEMSQVALRTLAGAGEAKLVEPASPISIGQLEPGQFNTITLTLDVPDSVNKLQLTESGTVNSGESSPDQFSLGQVIFPKQQ